MHQRHLSKFVAASIALVLLAAACADESKTTGGSPASGATPTTGVPTSAASNDWALAYTGGTAGAADPSLEPVVLGYVNQEGGVPAFPEATAGTEAAVAYINAELGGIDGHPLELKTCMVQAEEDGQRCGTEMVNDPAVKAVLTGVLVVGADSLFKVIVPKLPVLVGNPVSNADFLTSGISALTPGSPGVIQGMAVFVAQHLGTTSAPIESVAIVYNDNEAAKAAVSLLLNPVLNQLGVTDITAVPIADAATGPDVQAALQAAGAATADVVVPIVTLPGCIATYDALQALGITPAVVATSLCMGRPMTQHLADVGEEGDAPDGWYYAGYGYSTFLPDEESGMETYLAKVTQYGGDDVEYTGFAGPQFANVATIAKFFNELGPDAITPDAVKGAIESFAGPMMLTSGPMACGKVSPIFPSLCGSEMGVQQYAGGRWTSIADALNGKPINPVQVLAGS